MTERKASATWRGDLQNGRGSFSAESHEIEGDMNFEARFGAGAGTNPEELIGAAEASCFAMALSHAASEAGYEPKEIDAEAFVDLSESDGNFAIGTIRLNVTGDVPGIEESEFRELAERASQTSPVAKALAGVDISVDEVHLRSR